MSIATTIKRAGVLALASAAMLAVSSAPAGAHYIDIDPPGNGEGRSGWVGSPALPENADGNGLIEIGGGPDVGKMQSASHGKGLNSACESLRTNGRGVVDIYGPPHHSDPRLPEGFSSGCAHGAVIPPGE